jgi:hypothetical protein
MLGNAPGLFPNHQREKLEWMGKHSLEKRELNFKGVFLILADPLNGDGSRKLVFKLREAFLINMYFT